jgi:hypothetical protein
MRMPAPAKTSRPIESPAAPARTAPARAAAQVRPLPSAVPPVSTPASAPGKQQPATPKRITAAGVFAVLTVVALYVGWRFPTERYITPERGVGYALGIVGGSMMLLLFLYSARKRFRWLGFLGAVAGWFRFHMVLGILGPLCILYHSNFSLGAANSNVALFSMLTVAGSGLVGRYIYSRIHLGLYGRKTSLGELRDGAEGLHAHTGSVSFLPELAARLERSEQRLLATGPHLPFVSFAKPLFVACNTLVARWRLRAYVRSALRAAARTSPAIAAHRRRLRKLAGAYIDQRLTATRRVAEFQAYERLFSLWHALHLPLIFMLIVAAVVHIVAVHVY